MNDAEKHRSDCWCVTFVTSRNFLIIEKRLRTKRNGGGDYRAFHPPT